MTLLQVEDLRVSFPIQSTFKRAEVVSGLSFSLEAGKTLALVGESGCGKTMSALALLQLIPPPGKIDSGKILFDGRDLHQLSIKELQHLRGSKIGMVFQEPMSCLNPVFSVGWQLTEVLRQHHSLTREEAWSRGLRLLSRVGLTAAEMRMKQYAHELSGGMRQRVMIALALAGDPRVLIADEPTTALDVTIQAQILSLLTELQQERSMAMILISHDLGVVAQVADEMLVMYAGSCVESGPMQAVLSQPKHPYTLGLLKSVPGERQDRLPVIPGNLPELGREVQGCQFQDRCASVFDRCLREKPSLRELGKNHSKACFLGTL